MKPRFNDDTRYFCSFKEYEDSILGLYETMITADAYSAELLFGQLR